MPHPHVTYVSSLAEIPPADARLIISNELFDALPFARLVQRDEHLHELWVTERDGVLDWSEHEAEADTRITSQNAASCWSPASSRTSRSMVCDLR